MIMLASDLRKNVQSKFGCCQVIEINFSLKDFNMYGRSLITSAIMYNNRMMSCKYINEITGYKFLNHIIQYSMTIHYVYQNTLHQNKTYLRLATRISYF